MSMDVIHALRLYFSKSKSSGIPRIKPKKIISTVREEKKEAHKPSIIHSSYHHIRPAPISHMNKFVQRLVHLQKAKEEEPSEGLKKWLKKRIEETPQYTVVKQTRPKGIPKGLSKEILEKLSPQKREQAKKILPKIVSGIKKREEKVQGKKQKEEKISTPEEKSSSPKLLKYVQLKKKLSGIKKKLSPEDKKIYRSYTKERGEKRKAVEKRAKEGALKAIKTYKNLRETINNMSPEENSWRRKYVKNSHQRKKMVGTIQKPSVSSKKEPSKQTSKRQAVPKPTKPKQQERQKKTTPEKGASEAWKKGKRDYYYGKNVWWKWEGKPGERDVLPARYQRGPIEDGATIPTWKPGHEDEGGPEHLWLRRVLEGAGKEVKPHPQQHSQLARFLEKVAGKGTVETKKEEKKEKKKEKKEKQAKTPKQTSEKTPKTKQEKVPKPKTETKPVKEEKPKEAPKGRQGFYEPGPEWSEKPKGPATRVWPE